MAKRNPGRAELLGWVERVAEFWSEQSGLPAITGRVVGWLMVSAPPEQSAAEIAKAIGASRASLTTSMQLLIAMGLVRSQKRPGQRTTYYRIDDDAWEKANINGDISPLEIANAAGANIEMLRYIQINLEKIIPGLESI